MNQPNDAYDRFMALHRRGLYESHYLKANSPDGKRAFWIKHNLLVPRAGPSIAEFWLIFFTRDQEPRVYKRECALDELDIAPDRPALRGNGFLFQCESKNGGHGTGQSQGAIADASWDLAISAGLPPLFHFSHQRLYTAPLPKKKILTPAPNIIVDGRIQLGDTVTQLERWVGLRGHNWGTEHAYAYAYGNCNLWDDGALDRTVDGFSAKIRLGPVLSPWLSNLVYRGEGRTLAVNRLRHWVNRQVEVTDARWRLPSKALDLVMEADPSSYAGLRYRHPNGDESYCYNSKFANVTVKAGDVLHTSSCGELEILTPEPLANVPLHPDPSWDGSEDYYSEGH